jgi:hypothetical protein
MSIKNFTLIAATLAATAAFASTASAGNYFEAGNSITNAPILQVGSVHSDSDGVLALYNYSTGVKGALIGTARINAGANPSVTIDNNNLVLDDVVAVLEVNGQAVATKTLIVN